MATPDRHSRIVGWLKTLLPVAALIILSGLFLIARDISPPTTLPYAEIDLTERARRQQITRPSIAGATNRGDLIAVQADDLRPDPDNPLRLFANGIDARIDTIAGDVIQLRADIALIDQPQRLAMLQGSVVLRAPAGREIRTDGIELGLDKFSARATGRVESVGPEGRLSAGGLEMMANGGADDVHLLFTNGVKLIYDPQSSED